MIVSVQILPVSLIVFNLSLRLFSCKSQHWFSIVHNFLSKLVDFVHNFYFCLEILVR